MFQYWLLLEHLREKMWTKFWVHFTQPVIWTDPDVNEFRKSGFWWRIKSEYSLWVTVKEGLCCYTVGTCVLHVMWHLAGVRSTRRLMAMHPGASRASPLPRNCSQQTGAERGGGSADSSWMGTLYDNHHHFPSEDNTQGSLPEFYCTATKAYGANFVWRVWWEWSHVPVELLNRPPEASCSRFVFVLPLDLSLSASCHCHLCVFLTCATNHLYGITWHLLSMVM